MEAKDALNIIRTDIKNLEEISPIVPDDIIQLYNNKYPKHEGENIKRPNITNGLTEIKINTTEKPVHSRRPTQEQPPPLVSADVVFSVDIPPDEGLM
jgi:hypothetical protein